MSSTLAPCNKKKKHFLPSLGSRRRLHNMLEQQPADSAPAVSALLAGPQPKTGCPGGLLKHNDTIEEMASRLLDSPATDGRLSSTPMSGQVVHPEAGTPASSAQRGIQPARQRRHSRSRVEKSSPVNCRRSPKRHLGSNAPQSAGRAAPAGLTRPLPRSQTFINPLAQNPTRVTSFASVNVAPPAPLAETNPAPGAESHSTRHDEIVKKMQQMIAATNSLKPPTTEQGNSATTPVSFMMSRLRTNKVFAKVSSAFHSMASTREKEAKSDAKTGATVPNGKEAASDEPPGLSEQRSIPASERSRSPIASIELRLNEGQNLSRKKVQMITGGGRVARKPLADDGRSLKSCKSCEDPFSEPSGAVRTPNPFECRLRDSHRSHSGGHITPPATSNPFESERVLESSLDTILSSPPLAASTPRSSMFHTRDVSDTITKKVSRTVADRLGLPLYDLFPTKRATNPLYDSDRGTAAQRDVALEQRFSVENSSASEDGQQYPPKQNAIDTDLLYPGRCSSVSPVIMTKKHPSPTKEELLALLSEMDFDALRSNPDKSGSATKNESSSDNETDAMPNHRKKHPPPSVPDSRMFGLQPQSYRTTGYSALDDADELATSFTGFGAGPKTANALPAFRNASERAVAGGHRNEAYGETRLRGSVSRAITQSRLPRPVETLTRSRTDLRFAGPFRPMRVDPLELNELQWEASQYQIGQAAEVH